eukprot:2459279-Prymnesium_polylepis.1
MERGFAAARFTTSTCVAILQSRCTNVWRRRVATRTRMANGTSTAVMIAMVLVALVSTVSAEAIADDCSEGIGAKAGGESGRSMIKGAADGENSGSSGDRDGGGGGGVDKGGGDARGEGEGDIADEGGGDGGVEGGRPEGCLLYTSPSPRDAHES